MKQINKNFAFDKDMGLCSDVLSFPNKGIADKFYNVSAKDKIESQFSIEDLTTVIDKNNASTLRTALGNIAEIVDVFGFSTYSSGTLVEYVIFATADYKVYYYNLHDINRTLKNLNSINLTSRPTFETFINDGVNNLLISSKTDEMWVWNGIDNPYEVLDAPKILSLAVGLDRVFVITLDNLYSVYYSDTFDPTEWTMSSDEEKYISFSDNMGKVLKVVSLDNYIFVIREFGIVKIASTNNGNSFKMSKMYFSSGKIFENTICSNGDFIMFASSSGIFKFDGINCKRIYDEIYKNFDINDDSVANSFDGQYFLLVSHENQKFILIIDIYKDIINEIFCDPNIQGIFSLILNKRYFGVLTTNQNSANLPYILSKNDINLANCRNFLYKTIKLKLEPNAKIKTLRRVNLLSKTDVKLKVITDLGTYEFDIDGSDYYINKKLSVLFNDLCLEFSGNDGADISNLSIDYSYIGGE